MNALFPIYIVSHGKQLLNKYLKICSNLYTELIYKAQYFLKRRTGKKADWIFTLTSVLYIALLVDIPSVFYSYQTDLINTFIRSNFFRTTHLEYFTMRGTLPLRFISLTSDNFLIEKYASLKYCKVMYRVLNTSKIPDFQGQICFIPFC